MTRRDFTVILGLVSASVAMPAFAADPAAPVTYDQIRPVLKKHCVTCHNTERPRGDLDLSNLGAIRMGSTSGPIVVKGKPEESSLFTMPAHLEEPFMPPNSPKIPQRELDLLHRWIADGMLEKGDTPGSPTPAVTKSPRPASASLLAKKILPLPQATATTALVVSPRSPLAAVSGRGQAILLDLQQAKPIQAFDFPAGDVSSLKFSCDGRILLMGGGVAAQSGTVVGVDVDRGTKLFELGDETDTVLAVDMTADRQYVALGGAGRTVKLFRTADGEQRATLKKHTDWILALAFSPDGLLLASSDRFGGVHVWETEAGEPLHTLRGHTGPVFDLAWSPDGDRLLTAGQDGTLRWWNMHRGIALSQLHGEVGGVLTVALTKSGEIVCGGRDHRVAVWDAALKKVREIVLSDEVVRVGVTEDGQSAVVADAAGKILLFSLHHDIPPTTIPLPMDATLIRSSAPIPVKRIASLPDRARTAPVGNLAASSADLLEATKASALAEAAVKSAEEALARAKATAQALQSIVREKEAAARNP